MLKVVFTLDYEIHGNGDGSPYALMVEPTYRMMDLFERYGAKLTIMADVAEILKFREYRDQFGADDYHYESIVAQLKDAIRRGHDVQLHLHCSYFNARFQDGHWLQDWNEYNFAGLSEERLDEVLRGGKKFLEEQLGAIDPNYHCTVFRAANWAMSPSTNVVSALVANGFQIDTSVFKYGRREGIVSFDYTPAYSNILPWRVAEEDICKRDKNGPLVEIPIYAEHRTIGAFLTVQRLHRTWVSRRHRLSNSGAGPHSNPAARIRKEKTLASLFHFVTQRHAWKADFNQCSGRQLSRALKRAEAKHANRSRDLLFVLIGHSKLFTRYNERSLAPLLSFVADKPARFGFGTFADYDFQESDAPEPLAAPQCCAT